MRYIDTLDIERNLTYESEYTYANGKTIKIRGYSNTPSDKALRDFGNKLIQIAINHKKEK